MLTKTLEEFPNYIIYEDGQIWSNKTRKFMKPAKNSDGYLQTVLTNKDGERKTVKIHRLVAIAFIPNPNNYTHINHIDENKLNNNVNNLEWCSAQHNELYGAHADVLLNAPREVLMLNAQTNQVIRSFNSLGEASRFLNKKGAHSNIHKCLTNERKTAYGYRWIEK